MRSVLMGVTLALSLAAAAWGEPWPFVPGTGVGPVKLGQGYLEPTRYLTPDRQIPGSLGGIVGAVIHQRRWRASAVPFRAR